MKPIVGINHQHLHFQFRISHLLAAQQCWHSSDCLLVRKTRMDYRNKIALSIVLLLLSYFIPDQLSPGVSWFQHIVLKRTSLSRLDGCDDHGDSSIVYIVDQAGFGDFTTVGEAIDAVPEYNRVQVLIQVNDGVYTEKVRIPSKKPFITLQGSGREVTIIAWNDTANSTGRTYNSASVIVEAEDFIARNITFQNTSPGPGPGIQGAQAVALRISGDRAAFYGCGFYGYQDTLFDDQGRHYFKECYIEGSIDFICGSGRSLYEDCELHSVANPSSKGRVTGSITAQRRLRWSEPSAFSFVNCRITGTGMLLLGRAWGPFSRVIFANTYMDNIIYPLGWDNWGDLDRIWTVEYGEYDCTGPGANRTRRVKWSHALSDWEVYPFLSTLFIDGNEWLPTATPFENASTDIRITQLGVLSSDSKQK